MQVKEIYQKNEQFKTYMDKFLWNNPEYTFEQASEHLIIKDMAEYYEKKVNGKVDNWKGDRR